MNQQQTPTTTIDHLLLYTLYVPVKVHHHVPTRNWTTIKQCSDQPMTCHFSVKTQDLQNQLSEIICLWQASKCRSVSIILWYSSGFLHSTQDFLLISTEGHSPSLALSCFFIQSPSWQNLFYSDWKPSSALHLYAIMTYQHLIIVLMACFSLLVKIQLSIS